MSWGAAESLSAAALVSFQRIVERLSRSDCRRLVCHRDRQNANPVIVRQDQCARACRQIDHVSEQIRVGVSFGAAVSGVAMRSKSSDVGPLAKASLQTQHL